MTTQTSVPPASSRSDAAPAWPRPTLTVRPLPPAEHAAAAEEMGASFLQLPQWAGCKPGWSGHGLGWFDGSGRLVGVALALLRFVPHTRRCLAYLPEGPVLPWEQVARHPGAWLDPLVAQLRHQGAFAVRIGPSVSSREWSGATVRRGMADPAVRRLDDLPADATSPEGAALEQALRRSSWRRLGGGDGFAVGQPRLRVQVDLVPAALEGGTPPPPSEAALWSGLSPQWRRNVTRSRQRGVVVRAGTAEDLPAFCALYRETAQRDGFVPRPPAYFDRMWEALAEPSGQRLQLLLAELDGEALAAALVVRVRRHAWYAYGASSSRRRDVRAANALQWHAMCDAALAGCDVYDLRGTGATLVPDEPLAGLTRFKLGTGGAVREGLGEWELPVSRVWHAAFRAMLRARS